MSTHLESSMVDFELVESTAAHGERGDDEDGDANRMYVSTSTVGDSTAPENTATTESEYDALLRLSSAERNARLIGRRVDILVHQSNIQTEPLWIRGTILNFDKNKDVHWVLIDGETVRREYVLSEVIFRLVETEEEWVDIGERTAVLHGSSHEFDF